MKKFWKRTEGFTLVELVVVIAILGILAGVGTVGYSGYVKKANMAADQQLIGQVKSALELYYYSNPGTAGGYVILNQEGDAYVAANYDDIGDKAMIAAFGDNWKEGTFLKHADWLGDTAAAKYADSNYFGSEKRLLDEVGDLTFALSKALELSPDLIGEGFGGYIKDNYNLDSTSDLTAVSNAAVLYVADKTSEKQQLIQDTIARTSQGSNFVNDTYFALCEEIGDAAALAVIFAYAEGFAQYTDDRLDSNAGTNAFKPDFSLEEGETMDATKALNILAAEFNRLGAVGYAFVGDYMAPNGPGAKDMAGYVSIMGTVDTNKSLVDGNLSSGECFTDGTVEKVLKGYAAMGDMNIETDEGQVAVAMTVVDGVMGTHVIPVEWNK